MSEAVQRALDAVTDQSNFDWATLDAELQDEQTRSTLRALREIAAIARVHEAPAPVVHPPLPFPWGPLEARAFIARGAHGDVYRAWDPRLERDVALKLLRSEAGDADGSFAITEGRLLARVQHPNVVAVFGADRVNGQAGIWMELVEGGTVRELVARGGPLTAKAAAEIGVAVCAGLGAIHAAGLVHRDVKAQNVVRSRDGRTILMDLSVGQDVADDGEGLEGTPVYLAPELLNDGRATVASDIYATGVLLYFLVTGHYPVAAASLNDLRRRHEAGDGERLTAGHAVPVGYCAVVNRALSATPADRFASADDMRAALARAVTPLPRRWPALVAAAATIVAATTALFFWYSAAPGPSGVQFQPRDWVLLTDFENRTGNREFDAVLQYALAFELEISQYVNVVPRERVDHVLRSMERPVTTPLAAAIAREVAIRDGDIRLVLDGAITRIGAVLELSVRAVDPATGAVVTTQREEADDAKDVQAAVRRLSAKVRTALGEDAATVQRETAILENATTPSLTALREYSHAQAAGLRLQWAEAEAILGAALAHDPDFASAHALLAWALRNQGRPMPDVLAASAHAVARADRTSARERYFILSSHFLHSGEPERAIGQLEALVRHYPESLWGLNNLRTVYSTTGRRDKFATVMRDLAAIRPNNFSLQVAAAQEMVFAHGITAARPHLDRANTLLRTLPLSALSGAGMRTYLELFPVHELWLAGRVSDAAAALDGFESSNRRHPDGDAHHQALGSFRLGLGQLDLAEQRYLEMADGNSRSLMLAQIALLRGDARSLDRHVKEYKGADLFVVSLLVHRGDLAGARKELKRLSSRTNPFGEHLVWAAAEIEQAAGNENAIRTSLAKGAPWTRAMAGVRAFLYSETLARAALKLGDTDGAISVLEASSALREKTHPAITHTGSYWLRNQSLLAQALRAAGRAGEASAIEGELAAALVVADRDHPLLATR